MSAIEEMLLSHPEKTRLDGQLLHECVKATLECADICTSCADACLGERDVQLLRRCIRLNQDCADICAATGRVLTRQTQPEWTLIRALVEACAAACHACGLECDRHADHHQHCQICADTCRRCEEVCVRFVGALPT